MYINVIFKFIDNYEYGLKLMYKLNKNSNLHSEIEESGRRQRLKVKTKRSLEPLHYSSHSDEDDILLKDKPAAYPTFPKKQKSKLNCLKKSYFIWYFFYYSMSSLF